MHRSRVAFMLRGPCCRTTLFRLTSSTARFLQKFLRLSSPPKSVVKLVEFDQNDVSGSGSFGGIQRRQLNSLLPASVKGCGRSRSIGWRASTWTDLRVSAGQFVVRQMRMEIEGRDVLEQTQAVEVAEGRQRSNFVCAFHERGPKPVRDCAPERRAPSSTSACIGRSAAGAGRAGRRGGDIPSGAASGRS